jgi:hypothetical protein
LHFVTIQEFSQNGFAGCHPNDEQFTWTNSADSSTALGLEKCLNSRLGAAEDQCVDVMRAFVGVHGL